MVPILLLACAVSEGPSGPDSTGPADDTAADTSPADDTAAAAACGDGRVDPGEACDAGPENGATPCGCQPGCVLGAAATACDDGAACTVGDACDGAGACVPGPAPDCDDGDACTTDTCDAATGECRSVGLSGGPLDLWDLDRIRDPSTLDLEIVAVTTAWEGVTPVTVTEVRYTSWERDGCEERPVRIEAYVAVADGVSASRPGPGLVVSHGLGGWADEGAASTPAADIGGVALAYSGPGQGASEGTGSGQDHLFDTADDPRDSWFWEHAVAAMRGLTVLETLPEVDPSRLGMTGYSGGGVATLMVNGIDDRVTVAVPISATGYLDLAARATPNPGWEADLLAAMTPPRTVDSPEWAAYQAWLDPSLYLPTAHGDVLLVDGAQDQFFPLNSLVATYDALAATGRDVRLLAIKDWDHGWYALFNDEVPQALAEGAWAYWMGHQLGLDADLAELAPMPEVVSVSPWICTWPDYPWIYWTCAYVEADLAAPTGYDVDSVQFHYSVDSAYTFQTWNLQPSGGGWAAEVGTLDGSVWTASNLVWFVEVAYSAGPFGPSFSLTSRPNLPAGFSPYILPIAGPLP